MQQVVLQECLQESGGRSQDAFLGFPASTLLESGALPIQEIAELALREGQCTNPLYRVHRWFARRLGSQFRSILTGLSLGASEKERFWETYLTDVPLDGAQVLDPFVGGGTSLVEALRCGAHVIGYDIDPVATFITRFELAAAACDPDEQVVSDVCSAVTSQMARFHMTNVSGLGIREILHHFWVELRACQSCGSTFEIHPHYQLAYSREKGLQWAFCKDCHEVYELHIQRKEIRCGCGARTRIAAGTLDNGKVRCPDCRTISNLAERGDSPASPKWRLFAQEYIERTPNGVTRHFKKATKGDRIRYSKASQMLRGIEASDGPFAPDRLIPTSGRSDQRPLIHGITRYTDLFNERQLLHLTLLGKTVASVSDAQTRRFLSMAFSEHLTTNCMYTAYAFGYRRLSPMFSIHSYRHITRPVELNPWLDGIGRGTFPNVLKKIRKGIEFAKAPTELDPSGGRKTSRKCANAFASEITIHPWQVLTGASKAAVLTQTSESLVELSDNTVDLILTDPPYFDNLSYSELSDFYLAWHQSLGVAEPPYDDRSSSAPIYDNLALTNRTDESILDYRNRLGMIFSECHRVLKPDGICVFTYHHKAVKAWSAVGDALAKSGLRCTAVLPLRGEGQGGLHSYNGTIKWDAVFVCRKGRRPESSDNADVVVTRKAISQARRCADEFAVQLSSSQRIGFREPDRLNLERAVIAAAAEVDREDGHNMPLRLALERTKKLGDTPHAKTR